MTQQEFTARTGYVPSQTEFWLIHSDYLRSADDKDEFCKKWRLTNVFLRRAALCELEEMIAYSRRFVGTPKFKECREQLQNLCEQIDFLNDQIQNGNN